MLNLKNYNVEGNIFGDDVEIVESLVTDYSGSIYICDAISEKTDSAVPVYYYELYSKCAELSEWVDNAWDEGLLNSDGDVSLSNQLSIGAYQYYSQLLYNNIEEIIYNYAINYIQENYSEYVDYIDDVESMLAELDHNNRYDDIEDVINDYMEDLKEDLEEEKEEEE